MNNLVPFILYILVATATPGPNNITAMSLASTGGLKKAFLYGLGVMVGSVVLLTLSLFISKTLFDIIPVIKPYIIFLGMAYMLYLAFKIFMSKDLSGGNDNKSSFVSGILLQFVNAKAIVFCMTIMSVYAVPYYTNNLAILLIIVFVEIIVLSSIMMWGLFGSIFYRLFSSKYKRVVNTVMALLLAYCAVSLLF